MSDPESTFFFSTCQSGMENALKREMAQRVPAARFSFSQRGLVVFKLPSGGKIPPADGLILARTVGESLFPVRWEAETGEKRWSPGQWQSSLDEGAFAGELEAKRLADHLVDRLGQSRFDGVHVWVRDGLHPAGTFLRDAATRVVPAAWRTFQETLHQTLNGRLSAGDGFVVNANAQFGQRILDICLLEPGHYWVGQHQVDSSSQRWPGGVLPVVPTECPVISRAYYKIREAVAWSQLSLPSGGLVAEMGASPGGSCQWLLEQGCTVLGIDPAEIEPRVAQHKRFRHLQKRGREVRRRDLADCRWLLSDANVPPNYILDTCQDLLTHPVVNPEVLILTLKLPDVDLLTQWETWRDRVMRWGYRQVSGRQLVFNRQEICLVARQ